MAITSPGRTSRLIYTALASSLAIALGTVTSATASMAPADPATDPHTQLLGEYATYWSADHYDQTSPETQAASAWRGEVTDAGRSILWENDERLQAINAKGAADPVQSKRALVDADLDWKQTFPDALGPVLGEYFVEGLADGSLQATTDLYEDLDLSMASTGEAKHEFNYPRPFLEDRSFGQPERLNGLATNLDITRIDPWTDPETGLTHDGTYDLVIDSFSQAFPSGHTAYAYGEGIVLASLLPELGPEIMTRASEAGLARNVLGVHYPLDVVGGRISGHLNAATAYSDPAYLADTIMPAREELTAYLTEQCAADGHGDTLATCIDNVGANSDRGYTNEFTDVVSTDPVTDRTSALAAYEARMTYGFGQVGPAYQAPVVPEGAEALIATAFPELTGEQRRVVLAATQIDSGYPLDSTSQGWQRINLAAALSSKVTVNEWGEVISVEPGQPAASVVMPAYNDDPEGTDSDCWWATEAPAPEHATS
ncbi:phosphatase PAP2 family protein [Kocuria coralli]|uniref:Phosphatase PAP2 family protein n=1 Tax=Kocuria coralli TaxID=1461025 RepID=A0A5J5L121_9MICC|nr:phosphatase PAP2 family protein [Kocuria coralli]KAA9394766.1 phosphatase PAP2 family protein [Kocuria coralli]